MRFQTFSPKQLVAMTWWNRPGLKEKDGILCDGAIRSGKTVSMALGFFLWSMGSFQNQVFGICGKTIGALRRNLIIHLADWLGDTFTVTEHRSENRLTVRCGKKKNTYYLFGGQDETSYALIQGITLAGILLDEAALMPRSFVEQACARCSVAGSKLWFNCNPEGPEHWFYKEWIQKAGEKGLLHLHFTMEDNPELEEAVKNRYHRLYTGVFYRRFILGQWCVAEGLVYEFDRERHISTKFDKILPIFRKSTRSDIVRQDSTIDRRFSDSSTNFDKGGFYISVDYGTRNPFSAGLWFLGEGKAWRIDEYYHDGRATGKLCTDEDYCDALEALAGELPIRCLVIDPSAASMIAALRARGRFSVRKARNPVLPGIRLVQSLLAAEILQFSPRCENCIREFSLYCWAEGDVPLKENDHAMDDVRYFCSTILRRQLRVDS